MGKLANAPTLISNGVENALIYVRHSILGIIWREKIQEAWSLAGYYLERQKQLLSFRHIYTLTLMHKHSGKL